MVKREMGVRARAMRMVESREAGADPENRRELAKLELHDENAQ